MFMFMFMFIDTDREMDTDTDMDTEMDTDIDKVTYRDRDQDRDSDTDTLNGENASKFSLSDPYKQISADYQTPRINFQGADNTVKKNLGLIAH